MKRVVRWSRSSLRPSMNTYRPTSRRTVAGRGVNPLGFPGAPPTSGCAGARLRLNTQLDHCLMPRFSSVLVLLAALVAPCVAPAQTPRVSQPLSAAVVQELQTPARLHEVQRTPRDAARTRWSGTEDLLSARAKAAIDAEDALTGALLGAGAGALLGGGGFAAFIYLANDEHGRSYWPLALIAGGAVGAVVGTVAGGIYGAVR